MEMGSLKCFSLFPHQIAIIQQLVFVLTQKPCRDTTMSHRTHAVSDAELVLT